MNALEISDVFLKQAKEAQDLRWKRHLLALSQAFSAEWYAAANSKGVSTCATPA